MTEQEAHALAAWLSRVWMPLKSSFEVNFVDVDRDYRAEFMYDAELCSDVHLNVTLGSNWNYSHEEYQVCRDDVSLLSEDGDCHVQSHTNFPSESEQAFASEWMPFFRRCCWLSGANIEATNHEKTEWMQGFKPEELQAWNLKI